MGSERAWINDAVAKLGREAARSADTQLLHLTLPGFPGIDFYLKDQAAHPTGSLKHRLARSLFLYALCNGRLRPRQAVVDASSGSTAISEAWFARLLDVPFVAVLPATTAPGKLQELRTLGAECDLVERTEDIRPCIERHVRRGACFLDQFGLAEQATDWRGNNNIAESILQQMSGEPYPEPAWIVCGAGTGSIVTLLCDRGERYAQTLYDPEWRRAHGLDPEPWVRLLRDCLSSSELPLPCEVDKDCAQTSGGTRRRRADVLSEVDA